MRKTIITTMAAFALGGILIGVLLAQAQPAPPRAGAADGPPDGFRDHRPWMGRGGMEPGMGTGMERWEARMRERQVHRREMMHTFALIDPTDDRKLTPPDVQKIVEAFLLWNGNHTWKVVNVKTEADGISFGLATAEGSVIAQFTMDPKTGRVTRRG